MAAFTFQRLQDRLAFLGQYPPRQVTWLLALGFCLWAVLDVMWLGVSGGLGNATYDAMVRARIHAKPADPRIVIVDIDESSLAEMGQEFGRWPWPRDTLATVLSHIEAQQPLALVWDVVFSDADKQNPGGDAALDAAARQSPHSHFGVVRLPAANDAISQVTAQTLPRLWLHTPLRPDTTVAPAADVVEAGVNPSGAHPSGAAADQAALKPTAKAARVATVALIPPALPGVADARLGYNNGYVDSDGVLRRYRYLERLSDGSVIQSLATSVQRALQPERTDAALARLPHAATDPAPSDLIDWRAKPNQYPRVRFADVFHQADGAAAKRSFDFKGKVVIVGSTAPSLHDIHPTPLAPDHYGVDALATAIDNGLHDHRLIEISKTAQLLLAFALFAGIALWATRDGVSSLGWVTVIVPGALLAISYLSLNFLPVFMDLHLAAGLGLLFLATLQQWHGLRRAYWQRLPVGLSLAAKPVAQPTGSDAPPDRPGDDAPYSAWVALARKPLTDDQAGRVMQALGQRAADCRLVVGTPQSGNWPGLARCLAVVGPTAQLHALVASNLAELGWDEPDVAVLRVGAATPHSGDAPAAAVDAASHTAACLHPVNASNLYAVLYDAWTQLHNAGVSPNRLDLSIATPDR